MVNSSLQQGSLGTRDDDAINSIVAKGISGMARLVEKEAKTARSDHHKSNDAWVASSTGK
jgi:hypothetical protein